MKKFKLTIGGEEILWKDADGVVYGGLKPDTLFIQVSNDEYNEVDLDMDNVYFRNIGYIDFESDSEFDVNKDDEDYGISTCYYSEIEFTEEEEEESKSYWDNPEEHEGEDQTIAYIEGCIGVCFGEVRLNGKSTGVCVTQSIYFNDRDLDLEE